MGPSRALFLLQANDSHRTQIKHTKRWAQEGAVTKKGLPHFPSTASKDLLRSHTSHLLAIPSLWAFFKYDIVILSYLWPARHRGVLLEGVGTPISRGLLPPCLP